MADRYIQVKSFSKGLDDRRADLITEPGSLSVCQNGHINSGGCVEQRMSFAKAVVVFPATTFGLEVTASGLVTFGSVVNPGALPAGVTYRQCVHPTGYKVGSAVAAMTAVLSSCNFNGSAFVIATFDDGNTYAYYGNVTPMPNVAEVKKDGSVLYNAAGLEALSDLGVDLTALLNSVEGFTATANVDENGSAINGSVILKTTPELHVSFEPSVVSAAGTLQARLVDQDAGGTVNQAATAQFVIVSGAGTIDVLAPYNSNNTGNASLIGGVTAWAGSPSTTASSVVSKINARTVTHGYKAKVGTGANSNQVIVTAPAAWGALSNVMVLTVTTVTMVTAASQAPYTISVTPTAPAIRTPAVSTVVTAHVTGLIGAGTYVWSIVTNYSGIYFTFTPGGQATTLVGFGSGVVLMKVQVTDAGRTGSAATISVQVAVGVNFG